MRILLLFSSSELGGAERSLTRMALASAHNVYQVATLDGEGPWCDWVRSLGGKPIVFGKRKGKTHSKLKIISFILLFGHLYNEKIEIIYVCGLRASFWLRLLRIFMPGVKLVSGVRWNPNSNSFLDIFFRLIERCTNGFVDLYITNSQIAVTTLVERCGIPAAKIRMIYNGIAELPANIIPVVDRPTKVIVLANLSPRKGHKEFLKVISAVVNAMPTVQFIFVGRDDLNGEIQKAIAFAGLDTVVSCEGFQENISHYLSDVSVCALPSLWGEGCPTSLLESMAWGVPVVAYRIDGVPELIRDGVDGFIIEPQDQKTMAARIIQLLLDSRIAVSFGNAGRKKVINEFTVDACSNMHWKEFDRLIEKKN